MSPEITAIEALKLANDPGLFEWLWKLAAGGSHRAMSLLGHLKDPAAVPSLLSWLEHDPIGDYDHYYIVIALGEIGDARAVDPLIEYMQENPVIYQRQHVARALGKIGDKRAVQPILDQLAQIDAVRGKPGTHYMEGYPLDYLEALGDLADPRGIDPLIKGLSKSYGWHKDFSIAAHALANIGGERVVQPLIDALSNEQWEVRRDVVTELGRLYTQDERIPSAIIPMLEDRHQDVRRSAAKVLGKHTEVRAVEALIRHHEDDTRMVQKAAGEALRRIGTAEALAALR